MSSKKKKVRQKEDNQVLKKYKVEITGYIEDFTKWNAEYNLKKHLLYDTELFDYEVKFSDTK